MPTGQDTSHHSQLLRGLLDMCLLAVIADRPSYGREMVQELEQRHLEIAGEASIYPVLKRLEGKGLIESSLQPSPAGPARKYYTTTSEGTDRLTEWVDDWQTVRQGVDDVLQAHL
ncbi:MAG: PadR family transcriptional regulator [Actinomycetota bacterium]